MERDQRAQGIVTKSVKGPFIPHIAGLVTSKEIYDNMVELFSEDVIRKVISLRSDIHEIQGIKGWKDIFIRYQLGDLGEMIRR